MNFTAPAARKRIASLFLLPRCDMGCRFCASETGFSTMTFEQAAGLVEALSATHVRNLVLGGGEPFLWPHGLERLARRAREAGFLVQVCTNGNLLPDGFERLDAFDRYILPLEAADPAVHDRLRRGRPGHHAIVLERLERLASAGRELTVSTVVTAENLHEVPRLADDLAAWARAGATLHAWHLYRFLAVGRGGRDHAGALEISVEAYESACEEARRRAPGLRIFRRSDMLRSGSVEFYWFEGATLRTGSDGFTPLPAVAHAVAG